MLLIAKMTVETSRIRIRSAVNVCTSGGKWGPTPQRALTSVGAVIAMIAAIVVLTNQAALVGTVFVVLIYPVHVDISAKMATIQSVIIALILI